MKKPRRFCTGALIAAALAALLAPGACNCDPVTPPPPTPAGSALQVVDARVRSCEVLFSVSDGKLPTVSFGSAVIGETIPKAPRFAIAFHAASDATLEQKAIADFTSAARLEKAVCYDVDGRVVDGTPLLLGD